MSPKWIALAAGVLLLAACADEQLTMTSSGGSQPPPTAQASRSTPTATADETPTPAMGAVQESPSQETAPASAGGCLPGTWTTRMPEFTAMLPIPTGAEYLSGTYTFTFDGNNTYEAEYSDVVFRMGTKKEFVDVFNSWSESGAWIAGATAEEWDAAVVALNLDTSTLKLPNLAMSDGLLSAFRVDDPRSMVLIAGSSFEMIEAYGMVQGTIRTPPLSDEGAALIAIGSVDCDTGVLQVDNLLPTGASTITMDRVD